MQDEGKNFVIDLAPAHNADGRNANAFLEYFSPRAHGAGKRAPDICVMGARSNIKHGVRQFVDEHRQHQRDIGKMRTPGVWIIQDNHIAAPQRQSLHRRFDRHRHGAEVHRHMIAHGNHPSVRIKNRAGVIPALNDVGRD